MHLTVGDGAEQTALEERMFATDFQTLDSVPVAVQAAFEGMDPPFGIGIFIVRLILAYRLPFFG